ncbi:MAG: hypothetical protein DCC67_11540 [Planctomycetota bacterium]|nr:MAG: hypothetical protein DCC67_11540 [Planctomycetota bacterium]
MQLTGLLACLGLAAACGGRGELGDVGGVVNVDGAAVDVGTIQFKPADNPGGRGAGAAIEAGRFQLASGHGMKPGKYSVMVQASKNTGKTFQDPQRGPVPQLAPLTLANSPQEVEVTSENADHLVLEFRSSPAK